MLAVGWYNLKCFILLRVRLNPVPYITVPDWAPGVWTGPEVAFPPHFLIITLKCFGSLWEVYREFKTDCWSDFSRFFLVVVVGGGGGVFELDVVRSFSVCTFPLTAAFSWHRASLGSGSPSRLLCSWEPASLPAVLIEKQPKQWSW